MARYVIKYKATGDYLASFGVTVGSRITQIVWTSVQKHAVTFSHQSDALEVVERLKRDRKNIKTVIERINT